MPETTRHISLNTVITLRNFRESYLTMLKYLNEFGPKIEAAFPNLELMKSPVFIESMWSFYRLSFTIDEPLQETGKKCIISIGNQFDEAKFQIQIWIDPEHWQREKLMSRAAESGLFDQVGAEHFESGYEASIILKMYDILDCDESEHERIMKWLDQGILKLKQFIADNEDLKWDFKMFSPVPKPVYFSGRRAKLKK